MGFSIRTGDWYDYLLQSVHFIRAQTPGRLPARISWSRHWLSQALCVPPMHTLVTWPGTLMCAFGTNDARSVFGSVADELSVEIAKSAATAKAVEKNRFIFFPPCGSSPAETF